MKKNNIIIDARWINQNMRGIGLFTLNFLIELSKYELKNLNINIAVKKKNFEFCKRKLGNNFEYIFLPDLPDPLLDFIYFPYLILINKYELVHYTGNCGIVYNFLDAKSIITLHDVSFLKQKSQIPKSSKIKQFFGRLYRSFFMKYFVESSYSIITVSNFAKNDITKHFPNISNISFVYHGIQNNKLNLVKEQQKDFLIIGGIDPQKNIKIAVDAFLQYKDLVNSSDQLNIIGVSENEFKSIYKSYKTNDFINFLGYKNNQLTLSILKQSKCLIIPSLYESYCFPLVEAMMSSVSVICSNTGALSEIGNDYVSFYFDPYKIDTIVTALMNFHTNKRLITVDPSQLLERFNWRKVVDHYLYHYNECLNK